MYRNFVEEIAELNRPYVHIKNKEKVNKVLNDVINGGFKKLQAVFDFDQTVTKQHEDGKPFLSSFGLFDHCPSVTEEYRNKKATLRKKYFPLEFSPVLSLEEKKRHMHEWYTLSENILKGQIVPRSEIDQLVTIAPSLRDGTKSLFTTLHNQNVPVLIFSAGLGDVVISVLKHFNVYYPNVHVISNFLRYGKDDLIEGFQNQIIHTYNKNEHAVKNTDYYTTIKDRDNVILMGDAIGDVGMTDGMENTKGVLKIGFLYEHVKENLPLYMDAFDVVLEDDQTMEIPSSIIKCIKS